MAKDNSRSKKSRIKELFKNCIVGEAPAPQEGELQSAVPGGLLLRHPVCGTSCLPASLGFRTLVRRLRARTRARTLTHSRAHTRTLSLPLAGSWNWKRIVPPRGRRPVPRAALTPGLPVLRRQKENARTVTSAAARRAPSSTPLTPGTSATDDARATRGGSTAV